MYNQGKLHCAKRENQYLSLGRSPFSDKVVFILFSACVFSTIFNVQPFSNRAINSTSSNLNYFWFGFIILIVAILLADFKRISIIYNGAYDKISIFILYMFVTLAWSDIMYSAVVRLSFFSIVVFCLLSAIRYLDSVVLSKYFSYLIFFVITLDFLSVFVVPLAVHPYNDQFENLIGAWRGLHSHKNQAGAFAALSALLFWGQILTSRRNSVSFPGFFISLIFLINTESKTSIYIFYVIMIMYLIYIKGGVSIRRLMHVMILFGATAAPVALLYDYSILDSFLQPEAFTGRGRLWGELLKYTSDHFWLGEGAFSFFRPEGYNPLIAYTANSFDVVVKAAHNSYLEVQVSSGFIGFVLFMILWVIFPLVGQARLAVKPDSEDALALMALLPFILLHSVFESMPAYPLTPQLAFFIYVYAMILKYAAGVKR